MIGLRLFFFLKNGNLRLFFPVEVLYGCCYPGPLPALGGSFCQHLRLGEDNRAPLRLLLPSSPTSPRIPSLGQCGHGPRTRAYRSRPVSPFAFLPSPYLSPHSFSGPGDNGLGLWRCFRRRNSRVGHRHHGLTTHCCYLERCCPLLFWRLLFFFFFSFGPSRTLAANTYLLWHRIPRCGGVGARAIRRCGGLGEEGLLEWVVGRGRARVWD